MRRIFYYIAVLLTSLLTLLGIILGALTTDEVQTALARLTTDELSRGLGVEVSVGRTEYQFPMRLRVHDVCLGDQQGDTLAYVDEMYVHFQPWALLHHHIRFSRVDVTRARAHIYTLPSGEYNFAFLSRAFASGRHTSSGSLRSLISVENIHLQDVRIRANDYTVLLEHTDMDLHHLSADSLSAELEDLHAVILHEGRRFVVEDMRIGFTRAHNRFSLPTFIVQLPGSRLNLSGATLTVGPDGLTTPESIRASHFRLPVTTCDLHTPDLALWLPELRTLEGHIRLGGEVSGTPDKLDLRRLTLSYNDRTLLRADGSIAGITDPLTARFDLVCEQLTADADVLQRIATDYLNHPFELPREVHRLGEVHFRGEVHGHLHDFQLKGGFTTTCGNATLDGRLLSDEHFTVLDYQLRADTRHFKLGQMLDRSDLNELSLDMTSSGRIDHGHPALDIDATVSDFSYRGYRYAPLTAKGHLTPRSFEGVLHIDDPNAYLHYDGRLDFSQPAPQVDCALTLRHFRPAALQLGIDMPALEASARVRMQAQGADPDHMRGNLLVDSIRLTTKGKSFALRDIRMDVLADGQLHKNLQLRSEYLDASLQGHFDYRDLPGALARVAQRYVPSLLPESVSQLAAKSAIAPVGAELRITGHHVSQLMRMLCVDLPISDNPHIALSLHEPSGRVLLTAQTDLMRTANRNFRDISLSFESTGGPATLRFQGAAMGVRATLEATLVRDSIRSNLEFEDISGEDRLHIPSITTDIRLSRYQAQPLIELALAPTSLTWRDMLFTLDRTLLTYRMADTTLMVNDLCLHTPGHGQSITISGIASRRAEDALEVRLHHLNASPLLAMVVPEKSFKMSGLVSGWAKGYSLLDTPAAEANVEIADLTMCDEYLGRATGQLRYAPRHNSLLFEAHVVDTTQTERALLKGSANLTNHRWLLDITPQHFPLAFINHWTSGILDDVRGHASGHVQVSGDGDKNTYVLTRVKAEDASFVAPFVGVRYHINDSVFMDSTSIRFDRCTFSDDEGHPLQCNGRITHRNWLDWRFNLDIFPKGAMVLDLPEVTQDGLQGRVYANGEAHITGDESLVSIMADIKTAQRSKFKFSIATASSAHESNFVHFLQPSDTVKQQQEREREAQRLKQHEIWYADPTVEIVEDDSTELGNMFHDHIAHILQRHRADTRIKVGINVEVTPLATVQLLLDNRTGDMISAQGEGALRFTYDTQTDDYALLGTYTVQQGQLGFTLGNLIRRSFQVGPGSEIVFTGDPEEPELHVRAAYRVVANLRDLFGDEVQQLPTSRTSVPVNTWLNLSGRLSQPVISFDLELPMSEDVIQQQVRAVINTDEMLMRQVVYLLMFGRFFTPEYLANQQYSGLNETYSLLSSTVTGQINSWLGKLTDVFSMGVNIRTDGEGASASQEYEAQFMLQPVDRLVINGNVGYRYNDISNRPFFGDLDVEVLLTDDGQLRLKGYTHTVDKYSLRQANTIQGVGLLWRYNFNWLSPSELRELHAARRQRRANKKSTKK